MIGSARRSPVAPALLLAAIASGGLRAQEPQQPPAPRLQPVIAVPAVATRPAPSPVAPAPAVFVGLTPVARLHFTIDPKAPLSELLPMPPKVQSRTRPVLADDLARRAAVHYPLLD